MISRKTNLRFWRRTTALSLFGASAILASGAVMAQNFGGWGDPVSAQENSHPDLNTTFNDGCPIMSPDGLSLYMASNRPGGAGGQDIWVARRESTDDGWGAPVNLVEVNSPQDDFCPSPVRGRGLFFVSRRDEPNGDIYFTRQRPNGDWEAPNHLGPEINSALEEWSPSFYNDEEGRPVLYFSRNTPGTNTHDIYYSVDYNTAQLAPGGVNGTLSDARPNVRKDGLEIVWDSNRPGLGGQDIWTARRSSTSGSWGPAVHLIGLNSSANETRASLSWDGSFMLFGSNRAGTEGQADIYVTHRSRRTGNAD